MKPESIALLKRAFKRYYFYQYKVDAINRMEQREFGYSDFENNITRHLSFSNKDELRAFLIREVPADVYCSNAYYSNPTSAMELKEWLSADLIFDIDIKDLNLKCVSHHQVGICANCKTIIDSDTCNNCNSSIKMANIPCENCIENGRKEVLKLVDLLQDLGCVKINVYFSGNNGFHVHVEDEELSYLDSKARVEISDYVSGKGIIPDIFGVKRQKNDSNMIRRAMDSKKGWKARIIKELLAKKDEQSLLKSLVRREYDTFYKELEGIAKRLGASIDPVVTIDTHRIFRLVNTLSSKSGLAKVRIDAIDEFNPFNDACLLDDEMVRVHVYKAPKFRLRENSFGPYKDVVVDMPLYAAVYLICKGLADGVT